MSSTPPAPGRQAGHDDARTTVVIIAWDEPYATILSDAIASVRAQDRPARIVVVSNASTARLRGAGDTTVVESDIRLSRGEARNFGLETVKTEFVLFLDADDLLLPDVLGELESTLDDSPNRAACAMSILEGDVGSKQVHGYHSVPKRFVPVLSRARKLFAFLNAVWPLYSTQGATLIRSDAVSRHAYADADQGEDWALGVSLALRGVRVLRRPGLIYRRHAAGGWADVRMPSYLPRGAANARARVGSDPASPRWLRSLVPLIWLSQQVLLRVLWPLKKRVTRKVLDP